MNTHSEKHTCDELGICMGRRMCSSLKPTLFSCDEMGICMGRRCLGCQYNRHPFAPGVIERDAAQDPFAGDSDSPWPRAWLWVLAVLALLAFVFDLPARLLLP